VSKEGAVKADGTSYENDQKSWSYLLDAACQARYLGLVEAGRIVDMRNPEPLVQALPADDRIPGCAYEECYWFLPHVNASLSIVQVLKYYQNRGKDLESYLYAISSLEESLSSVSSVEELMALEGNIRRYYYESFNTILDDTPFILKNRNKRPPTDPLNALISFGNSLVYTKILTEIYKTHLDPRIGYLHTTNFRRFTLNLDVAEIFKPIYADRVLFTLLNKNVIKEDDFENQGEVFLLKERGRRLYVQEFEDKLQTTFYHRRLKRNVSYQTLIRLELYKIEKHLIGEELYEPFVSRW